MIHLFTFSVLRRGASRRAPPGSKARRICSEGHGTCRTVPYGARRFFTSQCNTKILWAALFDTREFSLRNHTVTDSLARLLRAVVNVETHAQASRQCSVDLALREAGVLPAEVVRLVLLVRVRVRETLHPVRPRCFARFSIYLSIYLRVDRARNSGRSG